MNTNKQYEVRRIFKLLALVLASIMLITGLLSCKPENTPDVPDSESQSGNELPNEEGVNLDVMVLNGTTGMGAAAMIDKYAESTDARFNFEIVSAADVVTAAIIGGEVDIAAVPTNLAAVLYNKTNGGVAVAAVNTKGVLYVLSTDDSVTSINDLRGKTVYVPGLGSNPEYILKHLCEESGLRVGQDVVIDGATYPSPDELATAVASGNAPLALLPEPKVTAVTTQNTNVKVAINVTAEWERVFGSDKPLVQGCIIVRTEILEKYPSTVDAFLKEYKESVELVNENPEEAAKLIAKAGIVPKEALALKAIPRCNICYMDGDEMVDALDHLYNALFSLEPKSVGGKLPDSGIYYKASK